MAILEKEIEAKLTAMVKRHGGLCLKWVCPGWAGVPDRILLLPGGLITFVELKRKGGRVSAMQRWWAKKLIQLGFRYDQVWSTDDLAQLEVYIRTAERGRK